MPLETSYRFSGSASLFALSFLKCDRKRGYGSHLDFINFNKSFLFLVRSCLETWHIAHRLSESASLLTLSVFMCDRKRGNADHHHFITFNKSFLFSVKCLETGYSLYMLSGSVSPLAFSVFMYSDTLYIDTYFFQIVVIEYWIIMYCYSFLFLSY